MTSGARVRPHFIRYSSPSILLFFHSTLNLPLSSKSYLSIFHLHSFHFSTLILSFLNGPLFYSESYTLTTFNLSLFLFIFLFCISIFQLFLPGILHSFYFELLSFYFEPTYFKRTLFLFLNFLCSYLLSFTLSASHLELSFFLLKTFIFLLLTFHPYFAFSWNPPFSTQTLFTLDLLLFLP